MAKYLLIFGVGFIAGAIYTDLKIAKNIAAYIYNQED